MQTLEDWRKKLKRKEAERRALGEAMESLEEWRIKEKVQQSANSHSLTPTATCTAAHSVHSLLSPSILSFTAARPSCVAVSGESADLRDVDVLVRCIGSGLLQSAGVAALFSTGCWWGLSRVRGMTSFRKVVLSGVNGATSAFIYINWSLSRCHESFLSQPNSPVAARTRSLIRSKLPDHSVLGPFTAEEDERIGRGELANERNVSIPLPSPPPPPPSPQRN